MLPTMHLGGTTDASHCRIGEQHGRPRNVVGEVISLERVVRRRRGAERSHIHATCLAIIDASAAHARHALATAPMRERPTWAARVRKLDAVLAWAAAAE